MTCLWGGGRGAYYGATPRSYLLENDGALEIEKAPALAQAWCVSLGSTTITTELDLIVVGNGCRSVYSIRKTGRLVDRTAEAGLTGTEGW